ncbi:MAG TPA: response regulator [Terriglobia bacterium]|nr:response regulator [Terriglobia bacterium]
MDAVVLIDNDIAQRTAVEHALRSAGYDVFTASDGVTGLELVREKRPPVVVTEIMLPGMHGFALCQAIRSDPALRHTCRIIVASSKSYPTDINKALELGAISYLVKPFPAEHLVAEVRKATARAPTPANEVSRLAALQGYRVLDTAPEPLFDGLTYLASVLCGTPVALISLIDSDRQWFKSKVGTELQETARDLAFCAHAIMQPDVFIVPDASKDERFARNVLVALQPKIRFYAGAPLITPGGEAVGTLCVIDIVPRQLSLPQKECLRAIARQVQALFELRRELAELKERVGKPTKT